MIHPLVSRGCRLGETVVVRSFAALALCLGAISNASGAVEGLKRLSLEDLMNVEVTSVSRMPERWVDAPAAIQVISSDDIRRSGATSLPAALRLANHLNVGRKNAHDWAISARGFNTELANKLLVLMDGRTIYTPLFSGVRWDVQDYLLEDLHRIEVVNGPGGTLWGANAVNGVINITSKGAEETQGWFAEAGVGEPHQQVFGGRLGTELSPHVFLRVYGKYSDHGSEVFSTGTSAGDAWTTAQGGFRLDALPSSADRLTLQGDYYRGDRGVIAAGEGEVEGGNLLGRWSRALANDSDVSLQMYYDRTYLRLPVPAGLLNTAGFFTDDLATTDLDFQHSLKISDEHRLVWGLGYRRTDERSREAPGLGLVPARLRQALYSGFAQTEITVTDALSFTVGTKLEHNDYTGLELEPNIRFRWKVGPETLVWGAVSRAVRTPSRVDRDIRQPTRPFVVLQGNSAFESETVVAYEVGYRSQLSENFSADVAVFFNRYDEIRSVAPNPVTVFPLLIGNDLVGDSYGAEFTANFQPTDRWRLTAAYTLLKTDLRVRAGGADFNQALNETADPEHQAFFRSSWDVSDTVEFDANLRWVDTIRNNNAGQVGTVPSYTELDLRVAWHVSRNWELSLTGQNLLHDQHPEHGAPVLTRAEIQRRVFAKAAWRF